MLHITEAEVTEGRQTTHKQREEQHKQTSSNHIVDKMSFKEQQTQKKIKQQQHLSVCLIHGVPCLNVVGPAKYQVQY